MKVGGLFSGIGGLELGLERAGMQIAWHCEQDPYCQRVLERHWPGVPCYDDVTTLRGAYVEPIDLLCGGFPCQDISVAGKGAGLSGARSGLWSEYARLIRELRPRYVLVENVPALRFRGLGRVLGDLAEIGYDAEWDCVPAAAVGAPHLRDRIWLVAYPGGERAVADASGVRAEPGRVSELVVGAPRAGEVDGEERERHGDAAVDRGSDVADAASAGLEGPGLRRRPSGGPSAPWRNEWSPEPDVGRVADGVPARVDRLRALGNAVVPQIPEEIGRRIMAWEA